MLTDPCGVEEATTAQASRAPPKDRWVLLALVTIIFGLSVADRFLLSIYIEPIKREFGLTDSAVAFATGAGFGIFYLGAGIPLGMMADRMNRRNLLALCVAAFGAATALTGLATSFGTLLLARATVGIGEAGCMPVSLALIADKFAPQQRGRAMTIFSIGASLGGWLAASVGGPVGTVYGWRGAMMIFGILTIPIAFLVLFLTREPERGGLDEGPPISEPPGGLGRAIKTILTRPSVLHTIIGGVILAFWGWGLVWWAPALLERGFAMSGDEAGAALGLAHGVCGSLAILGAAAVMQRMGDHDQRRPLRLLAIMCALATIPSLLIPLVSSVRVELVLFWFFLPMVYAYAGPTFAVITSGVPPSMRGVTLGVYVAMVNFAFIAVAPQVVGLVSDLAQSMIDDPAWSLRYALTLVALTGFWGAAHLAIAATHVRSDVDPLRLPRL